MNASKSNHGYCSNQTLYRPCSQKFQNDRRLEEELDHTYVTAPPLDEDLSPLTSDAVLSLDDGALGWFTAVGRRKSNRYCGARLETVSYKVLVCRLVSGWTAVTALERADKTSK